jgi:hypothetical protein
MLNDLAAPMEIVVTQLADCKEELGEMHSGTNVASFLNI